MRYKEFKEKVEAWGQKYNYETDFKFDDFSTYVEVKFFGDFMSVASVDNLYIFMLGTNWKCFTKIETQARAELFDILVEFAKTPPAERKDEKRFIIPLPGLVTTDGEQRYLSEKITFFASRRDNGLRQTWKEEHLKFVPEVYRQFAVELEEGKEY